jgi:hypothetical protein
MIPPLLVNETALFAAESRELLEDEEEDDDKEEEAVVVVAPFSLLPLLDSRVIPTPQLLVNARLLRPGGAAASRAADADPGATMPTTPE